LVVLRAFRRELIWIVAATLLLTLGLARGLETDAFIGRAHRLQGIVGKVVSSSSDTTDALIRFRDPQGREHDLVRFQTDLLGANQRDTVTVLFHREAELANPALLWKGSAAFFVAGVWLFLISGVRVFQRGHGAEGPRPSTQRQERDWNMPPLLAELLIRSFAILCTLLWTNALVDVLAHALLTSSIDLTYVAIGVLWAGSWAMFGIFISFLPSQATEHCGAV
jgi:hypothetical protein